MLQISKGEPVRLGSRIRAEPGPRKWSLADLAWTSGVPMPAAAFTFIRQLVWVLDGTLTFTKGDQTHRLSPGDSLKLGERRTVSSPTAPAGIAGMSSS